MPHKFVFFLALPLFLTGQTPPTVTWIAGFPAVQGVAVDPAGNVYVTGNVNGTIPLVNALQSNQGSGNCGSIAFVPCDAIYVAKFNPTGTKLIYSTYLSGNQHDIAAGIAVDAAGNAYVAGTTIPAKPFTQVPIGNAFVKKLSPDGSALLYTTYLGGLTEAFGIAVDANGNAAITGLNQGDFPGVNPLPVQPSVKSLCVTNDGGQTWRTLNNGLQATTINTLAIDPTNRSTLYTATSSGLYKSTDAGAHWSRLMPDVAAIDTVVVDARNPSTLYATYGMGAHLARSMDAGATWTALEGNFPPPVFAAPTLSLGAFAIDPSDSRVLWAITNPNRFAIVLKSIDSGDHWQSLYTFPPAIGPLTLVGSKLLLDPKNSLRLYACCIASLAAGGGGVYRSEDGGKSWLQGSMGPLAGSGGITSPWLDPQNAGVLYGTWYDGLARSADEGVTWSAVTLPSGLPASGYETGGLSLDASGAIDVLNDNGYLLRGSDHGATWTQTAGPWFPPANLLAIDPTNSSTIYVASGIPGLPGGAGSQHAFVARLDPSGGIQWSTLLGGSGNDQAHAVAMDKGGNVYVAGQTYSPDFPTLNPLQATLTSQAPGTRANAFVSKISADGSKLLYSSYLGGTGKDSGNAIALDTAGNIYVAGGTNFGIFPVVSSLRPDLGNAQAGSFLAKLDPTGAKLLDSTLLTGNVGYPTSEQASAIFVDSTGDIVVGGTTGDTSMPVVNAVQRSADTGGADFIMRVSPSGNSLDFSTYLGVVEEQLHAIAPAVNGGLWIADSNGLARIDFSPPPAAPVPAILSVNNAASFSPIVQIAPGEIVTLLGQELGLGAQPAGSVPLPSSLQGVSVSMGGIAAPLYYVSPTQINFQAPFELSLGSTPLLVRRGAQSSTVQTVKVGATDPGIFSTASGVALVVHAGDFSLVTKQNPAKAGEYVAVFCTGLGTTNPASLSGQPAPAAAQTAAVLVAKIDNGTPVAVSYAGLAPGLVGVYQVNLQVPAEPSGARDLILQIGTGVSNHVTLWVQ